MVFFLNNGTVFCQDQSSLNGSIIDDIVLVKNDIQIFEVKRGTALSIGNSRIKVVDLNFSSSKPTITSSTTSTGPNQLNVDYKKALTKFYQESDPSKVNEVDERCNKYKGKEAEMFVAIAKKYNKPNALNVEFETRVKDIDQSDYLALLTLFIQVFNPSWVTIAEKYLNKYKVSYVPLSLSLFAFNHSN